jgi:hypothetical protein
MRKGHGPATNRSKSGGHDLALATTEWPIMIYAIKIVYI